MPENDPQPDFQMLRKLIRLGHSFAVTIPDSWVRRHCRPELPYLTTTPQDDGSILLIAFDPADPATLTIPVR